MKLTTLFEMQKELDAYIQSNRGIEEDVFRKKGLALLVELAELANETRCFKFWSVKGPSEREIILEEYVDSIHFILSLGIEKNLDALTDWPEPDPEQELTELFLNAQLAVHTFLESYSMTSYMKLWSAYGAIAEALGFSPDDVLQAYISKNEENYNRQKNNY